jgi:hypothetical protein
MLLYDTPAPVNTPCYRPPTSLHFQTLQIEGRRRIQLLDPTGPEQPLRQLVIFPTFDDEAHIHRHVLDPRHHRHESPLAHHTPAMHIAPHLQKLASTWKSACEYRTRLLDENRLPVVTVEILQAQGG